MAEPRFGHIILGPQQQQLGRQHNSSTTNTVEQRKTSTMYTQAEFNKSQRCLQFQASRIVLTPSPSRAWGCTRYKNNYFIAADPNHTQEEKLQTGRKANQCSSCCTAATIAALHRKQLTTNRHIVHCCDDSPICLSQQKLQPISTPRPTAYLSRHFHFTRCHAKESRSIRVPGLWYIGLCCKAVQC